MSGLSHQTSMARTPAVSGPSQTAPTTGPSNEQAQSALSHAPQEGTGSETPMLDALSEQDTPPPTASLPVPVDDFSPELYDKIAEAAPEKPKETGKTGGKTQDAKSSKPEPVDTTKVTGMATKVAIGRFVASSKEVEKDWAKLTPENRAKKMGGAAASELKKVNVVETGTVLKDLGTTSGELDFTTWNLDLGKGPFSKTSVTKDDMAGMADTVYHEARHAEQWFRMARLVAGQGKDGTAVAKSMYIPKRVADEAVKQKIDPKTTGQEADEAKAWHKSVYGSGAAERNKVLKGLGTLSKKVKDARTKLDAASKKTDEAEKAYKKLAKDAKAKAEAKAAALKAWQDAYKAWQLAYKAWENADKARKENYQKYKNLPEEKDAWAVGGSVRAAYKT